MADPTTSRPVPSSVRRACQLFVASTLLGFVGPIELLELPYFSKTWFVLGVVAVMALFLAVTLGLIVKIRRGRNWARWTTLVYMTPSWVFGAMQYPSQIWQTPIETGIDITARALDLVVCWLLFFGNGASGFFGSRANTVRAAGESKRVG